MFRIEAVIMRDMLLLLAVIPHFIAGYFLMKKVDRFLDKIERHKHEMF